MNLVELDRALRQLRLSGMAGVLDTRLRQAQAEQMPPIDLVSALVTDELLRRQDRLLERRHKLARFRDPDRSLDTFDFDFNKKMNRALIYELATARFIAQREDVLFLGPPGTGKSHLAQALGHCAVRAGHDVVFTSQTQLLGSLHAGRATGTYERRFQALARVPLLIVDDFGLKPLRPPHDEDFHDLVAERYERAATLVTSNLDFPEWGDAFANRLLGAATLDRLRDGAYRIVLDGESHRRPRPLPEPPTRIRNRANAAPALGQAGEDSNPKPPKTALANRPEAR
jgi:DNA replication protein DnaC